MEIINSAKEIQQLLFEKQIQGKTVSYVPTMGYLHEGHLTLFDRAREKGDIVVASIFVNPTQFGPNEDFETYPRDLERDQQLAKEHGVNYLFCPTVEEMYPLGTNIITMHVNERVNELCGASRPGHFDGVAAVLTRLFTIIHPNYAFFGKKDAQQVAVVSALIQSLHFPIELIAVDTVREPDGLAKSSRNIRLIPEERKEAPELYQALKKGLLALKEGTRETAEIEGMIRSHIINHAHLGTIDYVQVLSYPELKWVKRLSGQIIMALAVKYSNARLIDNIIVDLEKLSQQEV